MDNYQMDFLVTEDELRTWMDREIERLGKWFKEFVITWSRNATHYWLEIDSATIIDKNCLNHPYGQCCKVCEAADIYGDSMPTIQSEGRKLYYKLRHDYSIRRDLGKA